MPRNLKMGKKHGKGLLAANVISFFSVVLVATVCAFSPSPFLRTLRPRRPRRPTTEWRTLRPLWLRDSLVLARVSRLQQRQAPRSVQSAKTTKLWVRALIFVALAEGIALYGLLVTFMILGRI